jgi:acyl-CoA dehydrogenase
MLVSVTLDQALDAALAPGPMLTFETPAAWWKDHLARTAAFDVPIDRAIVGAASVDRLGFAFAGGYAAALSAMVPSLPRETLASFAATEEGGAHPRAIKTTLTHAQGGGFVLSGAKKWVTLGPDGGAAVVVARLADARSAEDRPRLRVVRVDAGAPGMTITPLEHTAFVPEIPHASIRFDDVRIASEAVLPGDGYDLYLKPFRTIEDIHVHAALWSWLLAIGVRAMWPKELLARATALLVSTRALAAEPATSPQLHVALGGVIEESKALVLAIEPCWSAVDTHLRARWERDKVLLSVATSARVQRLAKAWETLAIQRNA